jgi:cytochrome c551/c552
MLPEIQTHLMQLKWLLILLIALVCPLLALMLGGTTVSLASAGLTRRAGEEEPQAWVSGLLKRANPSKEHDILVVLTIIASLLLVKIIYRPQLFSNVAWAGLIVLLITGLGLMVACRYRLTGHRPPAPTALAAGGIGVTLVAMSCFALACTEALLLTPEYWPHLPRLPYLFLSWHGIARFAEFLLLTGAITGNTLLFSIKAPGFRPATHAPADHMAQRIGSPLTLFSLLLWPPLVLIEMALIPSLAGNRLLSGLAALSIVLAGSGVLMLTATISGKIHAPRSFFALIILLFWAWAFMGHMARENVLTPATLAGLNPPQPTAAGEPEPAAGKPEKPAVASTSDLSGKNLFEQKCSICHRFDQRVVGPPLNAVVPGYRATPGALKAFLIQPVKRNPDYPAMPNLGLTAGEAEAIAGYLFQTAAP